MCGSRCATAVFIMESAIQKGIRFANVFTVGNCAQTGVEDVLAWLDEEEKALQARLEAVAAELGYPETIFVSPAQGEQIAVEPQHSSVRPALALGPVRIGCARTMRLPGSRPR